MKNSHSKFSLLSWLARIILYGSVFSSVFWPSYLAMDSTYYYYFGGCMRTKTEFYNIIDKYIIFDNCNFINPPRQLAFFNRKQQAYYLDNHRFADSLTELEGEFNVKYNAYHNYRIVQEMVPVQDLNQSLSPDSNLPMTMAIFHNHFKKNITHTNIENYLGFVYTFPGKSESGESEIITDAIVCEMRFKKPLPTTMPTIKDGIMQCPNGTKKLRERKL